MVAPAPGVFRDGCLVLVLHALLGDQQHDCCHHQAAADDIEQGGAHAAGAGQHSAGVVLDHNAAVFIDTIHDGGMSLGAIGQVYGFGGYQLVVTVRSLGFGQGIGFACQTVNVDLAVLDGDGSGCTILASR